MNAEFASPAVTAAFGDVTTALTARLFGAATSG
jgi:hypothetical protein